MTHEETKTKLAEITAEIHKIDSMPEKCGLMYVYFNEQRVQPCIIGNGYVLTEMLKTLARASDDFRDVLTGAVRELNEPELTTK